MELDLLNPVRTRCFQTHQACYAWNHIRKDCVNASGGALLPMLLQCGPQKWECIFKALHLSLMKVTNHFTYSKPNRSGCTKKPGKKRATNVNRGCLLAVLFSHWYRSKIIISLARKQTG